ncbi:MAG TPA: hypothetical protein VFY96_15885 [Candidatus Binatia bacterium]|nr:hypothetical protein [Candidatus Binatia bacterium]
MTQGFRINFTAPLLFGIFLFANGHSTAADKLRIGYSGATVSNAHVMGDRRRQAVQKNGIDPQILYLQTTLGQRAMIAGEIDMCVYSGRLLAFGSIAGCRCGHGGELSQ